ncbi:hypothetical protein [Methylobacterium dankookense]|uniref:Secreted protein n=1 Tax=Methylobacterium dankookense TaxID=560405 RepID=A0A564G2F0_9HYPH|nr:hypothetical protein [Methylobacterium dankookense]GJD54680.1 hypothetical protein IFDJLNFL_0556 [Methylobacterium dankookense]VUF14427.1 hypothetical protein MTDSW087_04151 [Methylobacterium dankookense]
MIRLVRCMVATIAVSALVLMPVTMSRAAKAPSTGTAASAREVDLVERQARTWRRLAASICTGCITPENRVRPVSYERVPLARLLDPPARPASARSRLGNARLHRARWAQARLRKGIRRRYGQAVPRLRQSAPRPRQVRRTLQPRLATVAASVPYPVPVADRILMVPFESPRPEPASGGGRIPEAVLPDGMTRARRL